MVNGYRRLLEDRVTFVARGNVEKRAQRVIDSLFIPASCRHNIVELCPMSVVDGGVTAAQNPLTIPELLLILEIVRHFKCHTVFADRTPESSSPATQALGMIS